MVATYVEILFGIRLTDEEACELILGMEHDEYEKYKTENDVDSVFVDCDGRSKVDNLDIDKVWLHNCRIYTCICCSKTTDVILGISLRTIYRVKVRCDKCDKYTLCDDCFNTTEQGKIDYKSTYSFAECPPTRVCDHCYAYNDEGNKICSTCKRDFVPHDNSRMEAKINEILGTKKPAKLYYHWDDCCSCT
jgi:hypothetical protein